MATTQPSTDSLQPANKSEARLTFNDWVLVVGLTLIALVMNISRPLTVDDPPYLTHAMHLAQNPAAPYSFTYTETMWPEHGLLLPSPPVVAVSSAVCLRLFGDSPLALQLWMTPWFFLLCWSMVRLARPWAGSWSGSYSGSWVAVGVGTVLAGPIVLPGLKVMLDIPAAALVVTAVCLTRDYFEKYAGAWALVGALVACGLAPLAKYSGFSGVAAVVLLAWFYGRPLIGIAMAATAAALFIGWELWVYHLYGTSHLLYQMLARGQSSSPPWLAESILILTSNGMPLLLAAVGCARGARRPVWVTLAAMGLGTQAAMIYFDIPIWVFVAQSCLLWAGVVWLVARQLRGGHHGKGTSANTSGVKTSDTSSQGGVNPGADRPLISERNIDLFLVGWLVVELGLMFVITPFPAYRRLMGLMLVTGLLVSRFGARQTPAPDRLAGAVLVVMSVITSVTFFHADRAFSRATVLALTEARGFVDSLRETRDVGQFYVFGRWSVPYYAPRLGIKELVLDETRLKPGDMVLLAVSGMYMPRFVADTSAFELVRTFRPIEDYPLDPTRSYGGTDGLVHAGPGAFEMALYRITRPTVIRANPAREYIRDHILPRPIPPSPVTSWAILECAASEPDPFNNPFAERFVNWGEPFVLHGLTHPEANGRLWTIGLISKNPQLLTAAVRLELNKLKADNDPRVKQAAEALTR